MKNKDRASWRISLQIQDVIVNVNKDTQSPGEKKGCKYFHI